MAQSRVALWDESLDRWIGRFESSSGRAVVAIICAIVLMALAAVYVAPELHVVNLGHSYAALSRNPFDLSRPNEFHTRVLTPLISYLLFLRGPSYFFTPLALMVAFLSLLYAFARREGLRPSASVSVVALIAFSSPLLFLLQFPGYLDVTTYILVGLAFVLARRNRWILWIPLLGVSLFNHESALFMAPWLVFVSVRGRKRPYALALALCLLVALASVPLWLYQRHVKAAAGAPFAADYYLSFRNVLTTLNMTSRYIYFGIFQSFKLFWLLPVLAARVYILKKDRFALTSLLLIVFGTMSQLLVATDTSRLMGLAFPAIVLSAIVLYREWGPTKFAERVWVLIVLNLLIPTFYVAQSNCLPMLSLPGNALRWLVRLLMQHA